eukprot:5440495-Amphidinium_carterae.1
MAEPLMGWGQKLGMAPHLAQHVANELKSQAAVMKETRKAKEERGERQKNAVGGQGGKGKKGEKDQAKNGQSS